MNILNLVWLKKYLNQYYPDEKYDDFKAYWLDHAKEFPRLADVETVNICDAECLSCQQQFMTKQRGIMSLETFKKIADILKAHCLSIRCMYTTGNPLIDPTLFEKYQYGRQLGIMSPYVGLNTTTSLLTKELHRKILDNSDNITLSFFATGTEFERLTGGLNWKKCYDNAIAFIEERDRYRPDYRIFIGCNPVPGSDLKSVKEAFKKYNVTVVSDSEIRWGGKVLTGVIDRLPIYPWIRCDGHIGILKIKWNGNIEACCYDFKEETLYANILKDDWETIRQTFLAKWQEPFSFCQRCEYYHLYWPIKKNHFKIVKDRYSWQKPFLADGEPYKK